LGTLVAAYALVGVGGASASSSSGSGQTLHADEALSSAARTGVPKLQEIDGGLGYYGTFSNPLPTSPSYFPIGVWGAYAMERSNIAKDKAAGVNTYVWFADTTTPGYIENARAAGMYLIVNRSEGGSRARSETFGRLLDDEMDMTEGPSACPNAVNSIKGSLPNDGRARYANYGKGVLVWGVRGWGGHSDRSSACFVNAQDITSTDLYWHTDPHETNDPRSGTSSGYGWSMRRMRMLDAKDGKRTPQWGFVEVTCPWSECGGSNPVSPITPAEIRGAVWHTLIAGARGIIYFQHAFAGPCQTHHALRETGSGCYGAVNRMVTSIDRQIKSLAPVLNAPFVTSLHSARDRMAGRVQYMVKWAKGKLWLFAGADRGGGRATFRIRCVGNATANVLFENRSIRLRRGSFSDSFADKNAIHIYRIDGGSSCGLK
jgi:hypothetical protein